MKPSQIVASLRTFIDIDRPSMVWGPPGIGKSEIIRDLAAALGIGFIDLRLSLFDPTDLKGYPVVAGTGAKQTMRFVPLDSLPTKGKGILLLDELPSAPPSVQNAAYQLVLDRRLHTYQLPPGWRIVGAGNRAEDGGVHYAMAAALARRFVHLTMHADQPEWDIWAAANSVDPLIRAFLRFRPNLLHDISARKHGIAFPNPYGWATSGLIHSTKPSAELELEMLTGAVGEGAATEFMAFARVADELPSLHEILVAPTKAPLPKEPGAKHAVTTLVEEGSTAENFGRAMQYISRLEPEFQSCFVQSITHNKRELTSTAPYVDWCIDNQSLLGIA